MSVVKTKPLLLFKYPQERERESETEEKKKWVCLF